MVNTYSYYQGYTYLSDELVPPLPIYYYTSPSGDHGSYLDYRPFLQFYTKGFIAVKKDIKISQFLPSNQTTTTYSASGNQASEITNFIYNTNGLIISKENFVNSSNLNKVKYYYANDTQMLSEPYISSLITNNIIGKPIDIQFFRNTNKIAEIKTVYTKDATTSNLLQPKYIYAKKGNDVDATLEKKLTYDLYDSNGNSCQYTQENGIPTSIIYGYNKTKPIAKLENVNYSSIPATIIIDLQTKSNADSNDSSELLLRNALDNLRTTFPNAIITTYTYDPLIGVTSVTDAKGDRQAYTYDSFGRLLYVNDKDGNTLTENDYHYKP